MKLALLSILAAVESCQPPAASPPESPVASRGAVASPGELVDVALVIPDAVIDLRYATSHNFVGRALYVQARCLLRAEVAHRLARAATDLRARGFRLRLWDCYRPFSVQERLWKAVPDPRYVARPERDAHGAPRKGSRHNRGAAVDLSLLTTAGDEVAMPTGFDDFTEAAHRDRLTAGTPAAAHARLLEEAMTRAGFTGLPTEWWHYDASGWRRYDLLDEPLTAAPLAR